MIYFVIALLAVFLIAAAFMAYVRGSQDTFEIPEESGKDADTDGTKSE
jgi:hypothetical protein